MVFGDQMVLSTFVTCRPIASKCVLKQDELERIITTQRETLNVFNISLAQWKPCEVLCGGLLHAPSITACGLAWGLCCKQNSIYGCKTNFAVFSFCS